MKKNYSVRLFCYFVLLTMLSCPSCKRHPIISKKTEKGAAKAKKGKKARSAAAKKANKKKGKLSLGVKLERKTEEGYVLVCSLHPAGSGTSLSQYRLSASIVAGTGHLYAATKKVKRQFYYDLPLDQNQSFESICLIGKLWPEKLKEGKAIRYRCLYQPLGAKPTDVHSIAITVNYYDPQGVLVEHYTSNISLPMA